MSARELNEAQERALFEAHIRTDGKTQHWINPAPCERHINGDYFYSHVQIAWRAWLAARRADLEISRPDTGSHLDSEDAARYRYLRATTKAIRNDAGTERIECTPEQFDAAIDAGRSTDAPARSRAEGGNTKPDDDDRLFTKAEFDDRWADAMGEPTKPEGA